MPTQLLIATTNAGKVLEIRHEFEAVGLTSAFHVLTLKDIGANFPDCLEDRPTFIGNAAKKARHFATLANCLTLADDSGLCVEALHGQPGVYSARYANLEGDRLTVDAANNAKLLTAMHNIPDTNRHAKFVCAMALAIPNADLAVIVDDVAGEILRAPRGAGGFGYDPYFHLPQFKKTTAELTTQEKNKISHRGRALRRMIAWIHENHAAILRAGAN